VEFLKTKAARPAEATAVERAEEIATIRLAGIATKLADDILRSRVPVLDARIAEAIEQGHPESDCWLAGRVRRVAFDRGDVRAHVRSTQTVVWRG
jgi:hypothetical protein